MRSQLSPIIFAIILATPAKMALGATDSSGEGTPYEVGSKVSGDIKLKDIYGKEHSLREFRGNIVLLRFWSIVCPTETAAAPKFEALQEEFGDKGVVQIAVNANQRELDPDSDPPYADLRDFVEETGAEFLATVDHDNRVTDMFGAATTPHCFVLDKEGVLRYAGALDDDPRGSKGDAATSHVGNAIKALLAGEQVPVKTTKPYG
jgi:thiol-disulfide isomerase/thioredoxin